jgi:tRNA(adenine34) deaminase
MPAALPDAHQLELDEGFMRLALQEADKARFKGEVPIGAVIVREGQVIAAAHNLRESAHNPVAHAELLAIQKASEALGAWRLTGTTLYVTLEPCFMCAGAIVLARIGRVVFGCRDPKAGAYGSLAHLNDFPLNHKPEITEGVLFGECQACLQSFFRELRGSRF